MTSIRDMTAGEHVTAAHTFSEQSAQEFEAGDILQGSEKLWGAAAHSIMAVAMLKGWPTGSHRNLVDAADRLSQERDDQSLRSGFSVARKFHDQFYGHGRFDPFAESGGMDWDRSIVADHVNRVLGIAAELS